MSPGRPLLHAASMALTLAALGVASHGAAVSEDPLPQKKDDKPPQATLSPEVEKKFKEFIDKALIEKQKIWEARMKKEIEDVVKATGLGDDGRKALEGPAEQAATEGLNDWVAALKDRMRKELAPQPPQQAEKMLDRELAQVGGFIGIDMSGESVEPYERKDWLQALHQTLSADQAKAWDAAVAAHKDAIEKEIADNLKHGTERIHDQQTQEILAECGEIELAVGLSKDRADKLEALGKSVVDQTSEMWRKRVERVFLSMEDNQRKEFARNGNIFIGTDTSEEPVNQSAWKDGVAALLTADEVARMKAVELARRAKRAQVMGEAMIMVLDEKIAFTEAQRQQLQPIADRLVNDVPELFPAAGAETYYSYSQGVFYQAAAKATDAELKPILDDLQREHWRHLMTPEEPADAPSDDSKAKAEGNPEPEDVEKCISSFLYEKTESEQRRTLAVNTLKAEDAVRVAGLKSDAAGRLEVAARGETEEYLATWKWFTEQQIRSQLQELTPQNVRQRLNSIQDYIFQRNFGGMMNRQAVSVWDDTVKAELTPAQQETWKKETDARAAFRDKAIADLIMAEFDRKNQITDDQWAKLQPVIAGLVHDYSPEIAQVFSGFNGVPWYMGGGYTLMPFAGVPDKDLKSILTKQQYASWTGSSDFANSTNLWQIVNQVHNQRVQMRAQAQNRRL
jgi:hypothetical protein